MAAVFSEIPRDAVAQVQIEASQRDLKKAGPAEIVEADGVIEDDGGASERPRVSVSSKATTSSH